jgi:hypothetical protein
MPDTPNNIMTITTANLLDLGTKAADAWNDCDEALTQVSESFGSPFEAMRDHLQRDLIIADREGLDLSCFSGSDSRFKFPEVNAHIIVRISKKPTPHTRLEKAAERVAKLEQELKVAKHQLKALAEELVLKNEVDQVTDKIGLAFQRLAK